MIDNVEFKPMNQFIEPAAWMAPNGSIRENKVDFLSMGFNEQELRALVFADDVRVARALNTLDGMGFSYDAELGWLPSPLPEPGEHDSVAEFDVLTPPLPEQVVLYYADREEIKGYTAELMRDYLLADREACGRIVIDGKDTAIASLKRTVVHLHGKVTELSRLKANALSTSQERAAFEGHFSNEGWDGHFARYGTYPKDESNYKSRHISDMWDGWKARAKASIMAYESAWNEALEEAARICDGLAKLYGEINSGYDSGYTMAAERAGKEIREMKAVTAVKGDDSNSYDKAKAEHFSAGAQPEKGA